ncbi:MAG: MFS transporter, partial [Burkholderiaceae bacterium]
MSRCLARCSGVNTIYPFWLEIHRRVRRNAARASKDYDTTGTAAETWRLAAGRKKKEGYSPRMSKLTSATVVLIATLTVQSLVAMCLLTLPVVAPAVAETLGISTVYLGLYIAFAYAGAMTASLLSGGVVRRYGAIRASQIGLGFCAAGVALCAIESPIAAAVGAVLIGLGYG